MRFALSALVLAAACGGPAKIVTPPAVDVPPPPPPAYDIATAESIGPIVTDATHVYWADHEAVYRRPLGPDQQAERLFVSSFVGNLVVGSSELFFVDEEGAVRAIPRAGGNAREVLPAGDEGAPWALHADGDTVWVASGYQLIGIGASGRKAIELGDTSRDMFAAAAGTAFVMSYGEDDGAHHLARITLATGKRSTVSTDAALGDVVALAVLRDEVVAVTSDGAIAIPTDGGKVRRSFYGQATGVAGDDRGYAVAGYGFVLTHERNAAPRIRTASGGGSVVALRGDYVYYTSSDDDTGAMTLHAAPRNSGAVLLRLPIETYVNQLGAAAGAVFAGVENDAGTALFQVGTRKAKPISPSGYIETIVADDDNIVVISDSMLYGKERAGGELVSISDAGYSPTPVIHKGKVYWGEGPLVRGAKLPAGEPFEVIDATTYDEAWMDLSIGAVAFAADHMFFTVTAGDRYGIAKVDEKRVISWLWTYTPDPDAYGSLDSGLVAIGEHLYVGDGTDVFQVALDGTAKRVYSGAPKSEEYTGYSVFQLVAAGDHLLARISGDAEAVIEIPTDGGEVKTLWSSSMDGGSITYWAAAADAVYVYLGELYAIAKIAL